jgi:hypothetical protein
MGKIYFTKEEKDTIIKLYTIDKIGLSRISKIIKKGSRTVIKRILIDFDVVIDTPGQKYIGGKSVSDKKYSLKNKDKIKKYNKEYRNKNKDRLKEYHNDWRSNNITYKEYRRDYEKNKKHNDNKYRLSVYTRTSVWTCLKERGVNKYKSTFDLLPFTLEGLMDHISNLFIEGMSWDNYGEWHLDHIKPMSSFKFNSINDPEFIECWSLSNLQPLWSHDNLSKGSKLNF